MASAVRGIVRNPLYTGRQRWNSSQYLKDPDSGKDRRRARPQSEWHVHKDESLRIVSEELFERARGRTRLVANSDERLKSGGKSRYLLSGLLVSYACSSHRHGGACPNHVRVRRDAAEAKIIQEMLGDYAIVVSPELVLVRRHSGIPNDIARLRGVRAAFMNETSQGSRFDEAKLKDLTGGDRLSGRFLHQEFFDFPPTHKLIIRGNHKPVIAGTDEGVWRRLRLIPFIVTIPPDEQDLQLIDKLRQELPGILRWAVIGCLEWQRSGLKPPAAIVEAVKEYREESDTLGRFIAEHCEIRKLAQVKSGVFFQRYQQFAETAGERWIPHKDLPHEMRRRGYEYKSAKDGGMYLGVELAAKEGDWGQR